MVPFFALLALSGCSETEEINSDEDVQISGRFLNISDIHFNPFYDPSIVPALNASDVDKWRGIFEGSSDTLLSSYSNGRHDADYPLLISSLQAMKAASPDPDFIIIPGDFLAHDFENYFYGLSGVNQAKDSVAGYPALHNFIDKTMEFLAVSISQEWPSTPMIAALGNNDAYCGDYMIQPNSPFLTMMTTLWKPMLHTGNTGTFEDTFPKGGYYSMPSPVDSNLRIVVLNTIFMSHKYNQRTPCYCVPGNFGPENAAPGDQELAWFKTQLNEARNAGQKVWVVQHIPPGIDTYEAAKGTPEYDYSDAFNAKYLEVLHANTDLIAVNIAGHYHMDDFRLMRDSSGTALSYIHLVPSISPFNGNNPGFEIVEYSAEADELVDYRAVYASVANEPGLHEVKWDTEYRFSKLYGEKRITAATLDNVWSRMETDSTLQNRYMLYYPVSSESAYRSNSAKFREFWCSIGNATLKEYRKCCCEEDA